MYVCNLQSNSVYYTQAARYEVTMSKERNTRKAEKKKPLKTKKEKRREKNEKAHGQNQIGAK